MSVPPMKEMQACSFYLKSSGIPEVQGARLQDLWNSHQSKEII